MKTMASNTMLSFNFKITVFLCSLLLLMGGKSWGQATLPISTTTLSATSLPTGFTGSHLGGDYSTPVNPSISFKTQNNTPASASNLVIYFTGVPGTLTYTCKGNPSSGNYVGNFIVQESANGTSWTTLRTIAGNGMVTTNAGTTFTDNPQSTTRYIRWYTDATSSNVALCNIALTSAAFAPPTLTAAPSATVDAPFNVTFTDNASWRGAITSITVGGTTLTSGYTVSPGQITFTPSASAPANLLQTATNRSIVVIATGYSNATVSQTIGAGTARKLGVSGTLSAVTTGGTLASQTVTVQDQYGNTVTGSSANITAAASTSPSWTIGGTTSVNASSGSATFSAITATNPAGATNAYVTFSSSGLTGVNSATFNINQFSYLNGPSFNSTEDYYSALSMSGTGVTGFSQSSLGANTQSAHDVTGYYYNNANYSASKGITAVAGTTVNYSITDGTGYAMYLDIFIDFNISGTFGDVTTEHLVTLGTVAASGTATGSFQIPIGTASGTYRMRLVYQGQSGSTSLTNSLDYYVNSHALKYGESSDYYVTVMPNYYLINPSNSDPTVASSWNTQANGSGSAPSSMSAVGNWYVTYNDATGASTTWSTSWTPSGTVFVTPGNAFNINGTIDLGSTQQIAATATSATINVKAAGYIKTSNANGFSGASNTSISSTNNPTITLDPASTVEYYGTNGTSQTISNTSTYGNLKLTNTTGSGNATKTAGGALTIAGTLTIGSFSTFAAGTSFAHNIGGDWTNNGTFSYTTASVINFNGSGTQTISGSSATAFYDITVNKGSDVTSVLESNGVGAISNTHDWTINSGLFKMTTGTFMEITAGPIIPATAGIWVNGATLTAGNYSYTNRGWFRVTSGTVGVGTNAGNSFTNQFTGYFDVSGTAVINIAGRLENSANGTANAGVPGTGVSITGGTIILCMIGNASSNTGSFHMSVLSNLSMTNGTVIFQSPNSATTPFYDINIIAGGTKSISGGTFQIGNSSTTTGNIFLVNSGIPFYNLTINSYNSPNVTLVSDLTINNQLTMNGGNLNIGALNLILGASVPAISGSFSSTNMIIADGGGEVRKNATSTATASFTFPIGDNTGTAEYSPVTVNVTSGSGFSSAYIGASVINQKHPNNSSPTYYINRYWKINELNISGCVANVTGTYTAADVAGGSVASIISAQLNGLTLPWIKTGGTALSGTTLTYTGAIITSGVRADFTGITLTNPSVSISPTPGTSACVGASSPTLTANPSGDAPFSYLWSNSGGTLATTDPPTTSAGTTSYNVTVTDANGNTASATVATNVTITALPSAPTSVTPGSGVVICSGGSTSLNATSAGNTIYWYTQSSGGSSIGTSFSGADFTVYPASSTTYYAESVSSAGCASSSRTATALITVNTTPSAPTGSSVQSFCLTASPTVANLSATGSGIQWYAASGGGSPLSTSAALTNNTHYYATQTVSGCESTSRLDVTAIVNSNAGISSVTGTPTTLCILGTVTYSANTVVLGGGTGSWSSDNTSKATVNSSTGLVTAVASGSCNIIYTITGGCGGTSPSAQIAVTINQNASINGVSGTTPICMGATATYTTTGLVLGGGSGSWSSDNTAIATVNSTGVVTGVAVGTTYIVYSITGCGGAPSAKQLLTVSPNAGISSVTGSTPLCLGGTATYSANTVVLAGGTGSWSSDDNSVATVSSSGVVTGVASGSCNIIYTINNGCGGGAPYAQQAVTINADAMVTSITGTNPLCIGGTATYNANTVTLAGGAGSWSTDDNSVATVTSSGVVTGVATGSCNVIYTINSGCGGGAPYAQQAVTIDSNAIVTSVTGTTPLCVGATATYIASGIAYGGGTDSWLSTSTSIATIDPSTGVVTAVAPGTCYIKYQIMGGCNTGSNGTDAKQKITINGTGTWAGTTSTDWNNASNWCGGVPTSTTNVVIPSGTTYSPHVTSGPSTPAVCNNLTINSGAVLTVDAGKALTAFGTTTLGGSQCLILKADPSNAATPVGSFIDNGMAGTGTVKVEKYLSLSRWWYIGSPVITTTGLNAFGTLSSTPGNGTRVLDWNETTHAYVTIVNTDNLVPALGYAFQEYGGSPVTATYTGKPNSGTVTANLSYTTGTKQGFNLVSNPYPSAINWGSSNAPQSGLTQTHLESTIQYKVPGTYATWNSSGNGTGVNGGTQYIPAMQAFWVRVASGNATGSIQFTNAIRVHSNQGTYKLGDPSNLFRIEIARAGLVDEAVVTFYNGALAGYEDYDSQKMLSDEASYPQLYTITNDAVNVAINGQPALTSGTETIVPVGFVTYVAGSFTITATNLGQFDATTTVYLEDAVLHITQELSSNSTYTFTSATGTFNSRFKLHFNKTTVALPVHLLSFDARCSGGNVDINWSTATETNNDYFTIERSTNASDWNFLKKVTAAGNSNSVRNYSTMDNDPLSGISYYRLKQTDFNGQTEAFNATAVDCIAENSQIQINCFPNPFTSLVTAVINNSVSGNANVDVYNIFGSKVYSKSLSHDEMELKTFTLDLAALAEGIYFVEFHSETFSGITKIVKN